MRRIFCGEWENGSFFDLTNRLFRLSAATELSLWRKSACSAVENGSHLSAPSCGEFRRFCLFHRGVESLSTLSKADPCRKRGIFRKNREILENFTNFQASACAKLIFSTRFSTTCGKVLGKSTSAVWNEWKSLGTKHNFPQRRGGDVISFRLSFP